MVASTIKDLVYREFMSRLVVQGTQESGREISLKPGANRLGRNELNDHQINEPTVSGFHCQIDLDHGVVSVKDLGSTNGTFINSVPVGQATLEPGQTLRLGSVELFFPADAPQPTPFSAPPLRAGVRLTKAQADFPPTVPSVAPRAIEPPPLASCGPNDCRNHPGSLATLICNQCGALLCKSCVKTIRAGARNAHSCLVCGGICVNLVDHRKAVDKENATFLRLLPTAFKYPLQKNGPIILFCGTILFTLLDLARLVLGRTIGPLGFAYWLTIIMSVGYLFTYMQNIIVASSSGEENPPGWPELSGFWDDVVLPALRCGAIWLVAIGPGVAAMIFVSPAVGVLVLLLGLFCVPMALLTVCLADSVMGLNPIIIFSSISKVPGPYLIACAIFLVIIGLGTLCESLLGLSPIFILPAVVGKFVSLYGMTVVMRILGLLYYTNKEKFSWFD